jgi:hypothetical protein
MFLMATSEFLKFFKKFPSNNPQLLFPTLITYTLPKQFPFSMESKCSYDIDFNHFPLPDYHHNYSQEISFLVWLHRLMKFCHCYKLLHYDGTQCFKFSSTSIVSMLNTFVCVLPLAGEENWHHVVELLQFLLSKLPVPQETNSFWHW